MAKEITTADFEAEVLQSDLPVLVDFWAPWCGPCQMLMPTISEIAKEMEGKAKIVKVNTDEEPDLAAKYAIMTIPTLIVFKDGEIDSTTIGGKPKQEIIDLLV